MQSDARIIIFYLSVINVVMASVVQTGKFGPGNSDIQACKENPAKAKFMCSFGKVMMYVAPSRLVSSTLPYMHALEGLLAGRSRSIESHWWCFLSHYLRLCISGWFISFIYRAPESPHAHQLPMDVLALIRNALMGGYYWSSHTHTEIMTTSHSLLYY